MPNIEQVPKVEYHPLDPYHYLIDNMPFQGIMTRIDMVNNAVNIVSDQVRDSVGTTGSLNGRLSQSIDADGNLLPAAVDQTLHSVGAHTEGLYGGTYYVRFTQDEQAKLALISDEASDITFQIDTAVTPVLLESGVIEVEESDGITWTVAPGNKVKASLTFPTTAVHRHYYDQEPLFVGVSPDYINYKISSIVVPFVEGSMRVIVNGFRLSQEQGIEVMIGTDSTVSLSFTEAPLLGTFALSEAITATDVIRIDFDIELT